MQRLKVPNTSARIYAHTTSDGLNLGCIVTDDGVCSIDLPSTVAETLAWRAEISQITDRPLRGVIFTSARRALGDALRALSHKPGTAILPALIHETGFQNMFALLEHQYQNRLGEPLSPAQLRERGVLPELTFTESATFTLGGRDGVQLDVARVGGFMPGSSVVTVRGTDVLFAGDLLSKGAPPAIAPQTDVEAWLEVLSALRKRKNVKTVVPGMGPVCDQTCAVETADYLKSAQTAVRKLVKSNRSRETLTVLLAETLAKYPAAARSLSLQQRALSGLEALYDILLAQPAEVVPAA